MMTDSVCSLGSVISASTSGDALSPSYWMVNTGGTNYQQSNNIYISDCGSNQGFSDLECLENNEYKDEICVSTNTSWWEGEQTFSVYDQLCSNDKPVYKLAVALNDTTSIGLDGVSVDVTVQEMFYLHYQPTYLLVTDNETTPQWMLSRDEISIEYIAVCRQQDLMKCTESEWMRKVTQFADEDALNGIVLDILDSYLTVSDGACKSSSMNTEEGKWSSTATTVVVFVILALLLIVCIAGFCIWRRMNLKESMVIKEAVNSGQYSLMATDTAAGTAIAEMEESPELEVNVNVEADNRITTQ